MTESLFSSSWYRVAELRPRLRSHAEFHRHHTRGERWYVLRDRSSGRHHRLTPDAYELVALMDGERSMQEIWSEVLDRLEDDAPTQDETIRLLAQLHAADVLQCDVPPDALELFRRRERRERARWKRRLGNPLALRFPLLDPDPWLERHVSRVRPLFSRHGALAWLLVVGVGAVLAALHWSELTHGVADRVFAAQNLLLLALVYPLVKALHELGHAFATKVWGGEVHEMGIVLLVLVPVPYVDASAASAFPERRRRVVVGAAGIMVELFLASLALFVWLAVEPGLVRTLAFDVMMIGGISTLLFNGNPLLRFDGYYVFADLLDIPNLGARANGHIGYLAQRHLLGMRDAESPASAPGERAWFVVYALAAFGYRLFILGVIALFLARRFFLLGAALGALAIFAQVILPGARQLSFALFDRRVAPQRSRAVGVVGGVVVAILTLLFAVPFPLWSSAHGVVWLPEQSQVRAGTDGFVVQLLVPSGTSVEPGRALVELEDPLLDASVWLLEARRGELVARYDAERRRNQMRAEILLEEVRAADAELARARERKSETTLRSAARGTFVVPRAEDLPGRFVGRGERIGYVVDPSKVTARVVVSQADVGLVRERTTGVEVRLAERLWKVLPASLAGEVPAATDRLPSPALGSAGGGPLPVDPSDAEGTAVLEDVFQFDLRLPPDARAARLGGRVFARFEHGNEPLFWQASRRVRQLLLSVLGV